MAMIEWVKPCGGLIKTNDKKATIKVAEAAGWKLNEAEKPKAKPKAKRKPRAKKDA